MSYKFSKEDEHTFTVLHPDGSEFQIAKNAVGPEVHKRIKSLEPIKMAKGGVVPEEDLSVDLNPTLPQDLGVPSQRSLDTASLQQRLSEEPAPEMPNGNPFSGRAMGTDELKKIASEQISKEQDSANASRTPQSEAIPQQAIAIPAAPAVMQPAAPTPQNLQTGMNDAYGQAFAQKEASVKAQAAAQEQAGKSQAAAFSQQQEQLANTNAHYEQEHAAIDAEHKQIVDAMMKDKIDPNRYLSNMATGNKIVAAIGVALSGIGSGLTGQPNMAMSVMQKALDRDIEGQKMELGKKQTLLSENLHRYGNLTAATNQTMLQMNAMTQARVSQIAATSGSQQALASAQGMLGDLKLQQAQLQQKQTVLNMAAKGGNFDPAVLVPHLVPEAHQKEVFKSIEAASNTRRMGDAILKSFEDAAKENTVARTGAGMLRTPGSVYALHQSMQPTFADLEGTVRQAAMDNTFTNITPMPGDTEHKISQKRESLKDYLKSKASASTARAYGIDLDKFVNTTTQHESAPVARQTSDGKTALFDPNTKKFLRYQ